MRWLVRQKSKETFIETSRFLCKNMLFKEFFLHVGPIRVCGYCVVVSGYKVDGAKGAVVNNLLSFMFVSVGRSISLFLISGNRVVGKLVVVGICVVVVLKYGSSQHSPKRVGS